MQERACRCDAWLAWMWDELTRPMLPADIPSTQPTSCSLTPPIHPPCPLATPQAITTLLKTGNESSIDRLLKQIGGFMGEIADEFKVVVVEAIKALCLKFPQVGRRQGWDGAQRGV